MPRMSIEFRSSAQYYNNDSCNWVYMYTSNHQGGGGLAQTVTRKHFFMKKNQIFTKCIYFIIFVCLSLWQPSFCFKLTNIGTGLITLHHCTVVSLLLLWELLFTATRCSSNSNVCSKRSIRISGFCLLPFLFFAVLRDTIITFHSRTVSKGKNVNPPAFHQPNICWKTPNFI